MSEAATDPQPARRRPLLFIVPLVLFALTGVFLAIGLSRDPSTLPSALVGKPAPTFALPPLEGRDDHGFASTDLGGRPTLVNVFASWCVPCRIEHPVISRLAEQGVAVQGIDYKDKPEDARVWLRELGDPFQHLGADRDGRVAIEWGVYGVPETFVVDKNGRIAYRHVGPLQPRDVEEKILPLLEKLK
ncbi:DsbE family thiol:disulfide interchange protein [Benzoatithermus flavus]|uniref:DsbE family thiol:disulfide interchange protein n=1 Tax=Benzoatithermus flavus TaxID=3108223 RepID=A0ABU8XX85_9PROT